MTDKIIKFIKKLTRSEKEKIQKAISCILKNKLERLDIKKLVGSRNLYRLRIGKIRIIYQEKNNINSIIDIDYRGSIY